MKIFLYGLVLATVVSWTSCNLKSEISSVPLSIESNTTPLLTGKVSNDRTYSGQDCVMYKGSLYWTKSQGYSLCSDDFQLIGTITEMFDKVPVENFTSAKSKAGSKIYIKKEDENRIFIEGELEPGKPLLISFVRRLLQ